MRERARSTSNHQILLVVRWLSPSLNKSNAETAFSPFNLLLHSIWFSGYLRSKGHPFGFNMSLKKDNFPFVMPRNHTSSSQRHLKFNKNKLFGCFPRKLSSFLYPSSPRPPSAMKGRLHGCDVSISTVPSPDATCFYYNRLVPLVLIKYSVCSRPSIHQKYIQPHPRLQLSVLLFFPFTASPCCLFAVFLSPFLARVKCARLRTRVCVWHVCKRIQSEQMRFSGSGAFSISATPGNYHPKTPSHNTSINVTYRRHLATRAHQWGKAASRRWWQDIPS